jgi:hypothetical protein
MHSHHLHFLDESQSLLPVRLLLLLFGMSISALLTAARHLRVPVELLSWLVVVLL